MDFIMWIRRRKWFVVFIVIFGLICLALDFTSRLQTGFWIYNNFNYTAPIIVDYMTTVHVVLTNLLLIILLLGNVLSILWIVYRQNVASKAFDDALSSKIAALKGYIDNEISTQAREAELMKNKLTSIGLHYDLIRHNADAGWRIYQMEKAKLVIKIIDEHLIQISSVKGGYHIDKVKEVSLLPDHEQDVTYDVLNKFMVNRLPGIAIFHDKIAQELKLSVQPVVELLNSIDTSEFSKQQFEAPKEIKNDVLRNLWNIGRRKIAEILPVLQKTREELEKFSRLE